MNASRFMDKQIMDLSQFSMAKNSNNNNDFIDLMNPQSEEEGEQQQQQQVEINDGLNKKKSEILPNYDFHPIHRPTLNSTPASINRDWTSLDDHNNNPIKHNSSSLRSYSSLDNVEPDKIVVEKAHKLNDSAILSEIDLTMKKHTDTLMHAIDCLSAKLSQMESRTRHLEHSVDELKVSVGNNHGRADGKLRQLENILLEVQSGVQMLKDKQEVMEGQMQLAKLQISKTDQSPEFPNALHQGPVPSTAPHNAHPPSQQNNHPPHPMTSQIPLTTPPPGPHRDTYFPLPTQTPDSSSQHYQIPPPGQNQQPPPPPPQQPPQQYQSAPPPPYTQLPQPPQQQQFPPSLGHRVDESPYMPSQPYPSNLHQPNNVPPPTQSYYGSPSPTYELPPPPVSSSFPSSYVPPSGPTEPFPYGPPASHYNSGSSVKPPPRSPRGGGAGNYPQLPTARVLPQAIPTASGISGGSSSGGSGNKVPIDDVVDKVTNMGFLRDQVRATVQRLTENGQSVDLNVVLDKLMNDVDVQPPRGWLGR